MYCDLADGLKIFYTEVGNPDAKPIIFINGLSQSTPIWTSMVTLLGQGYRMILFDLIYQGQSDKTPESYSISQQGDTVIALMDHLKLDKTSLVGISYGSIVSQNLIVRYPERLEKVVLLSSFDRKTARFVEIDRLFSSAMNMGGLPHMIDTLYPFSLGPLFFENPPMPLPQMKELGLEINDAKSITRLMTALMSEPNYIEQLKQATTKTLVVHGAFDFLCLPDTAKSLASHIPDARFELINGVGHTLNVEAVPQVVELIQDFI